MATGRGPRGKGEWHTDRLDRLPGLKFMRTLGVCNLAGGPFAFADT
jgi:hemoglobin